MYHSLTLYRHCTAADNPMDVEYLKNSVLKMYRTGEAETLLPVFATILAFSPEEVKRCKEGIIAIKKVWRDGRTLAHLRGAPNIVFQWSRGTAAY